VIAGAAVSTGDWIALVIVAGAAPVLYWAAVELERWRDRRRARRHRGGTVDLRKRGSS
jgi:hypothetical protein